MTTRSRPRSVPQAVPAGVVAALAVTLITWGTAFVAIRVAVRSVGPFELAALRLLGAGVLLVALAPVLRLRLPRRRDLGRICLAGVTGMAAYQVLLNAGEIGVDAGTASILVATQPIFAALLARVALREPLGRRKVGGIALAFLGTAAIALGSSSGNATFTGRAAFVLGAAAMLGTCFVLQKPLLAHRSPLEVTAYMTWIGGACLLPVLLFGGTPGGAISPSVWLALAWLVIAASTAGWVSWSYVLAHLEVGVAATWLYLGPLVALLTGAVLLGERPTPVSLIGGCGVVIGVVITTTSRAR